MIAASAPNQLVGCLALGGLVFAGFWRLIVWVRSSPIHPDPWDAATEEKLSALETVEVCHHCSTPQPANAWFCEYCGSAVGPYNNLMPYVCIFSQGEILRNGVNARMRKSPLTVFGYLLYSLGNYAVFAPLYWFLLFKQFKRLDEEQLTGPEIFKQPPT